MMNFSILTLFFCVRLILCQNDAGSGDKEFDNNYCESPLSFFYKKSFSDSFLFFSERMEHKTLFL